MTTPDEFITNWRGTTLKERSSYQAHFIALCHMLGYAPPSGAGTDKDGKIFMFEYGMKKDTGGQGFADVYYEDHFAIEYKAPGKYKTLNDALTQLKQYRENLNNPPLLIITDIENWEIHTNFTNAANRSYTFTNDQINQPHVLGWLRDLFEDPNRLHPNRTAAQVTEDASKVFYNIAKNMRDWQAEPERIAHFLTKVVFCLFAEDIGLLPVGMSGDGIFTEIVSESKKAPGDFVDYMQQLFEAMAEGGKVLMRRIDWFNGSLFEDINVEELTYDALVELEEACRLDWSSIEPSIFGTLFERSLDPSKRSQLGAHYTGRDDILLIVEPVLMQPLRREWDRIRAEAEQVRTKFDSAKTRSAQSTQRNKLEKLREEMLAQLREVTVLDPACGSGNFLYVSLGLLLDLEKEVITYPIFADIGLTTPLRSVHPRQLYGIEINPIAHALTSIVVWIGYIQWQKDNGYVDNREPILEDLHENIMLMDAIMHFDEDGNPYEPNWPQVDVIVGNPPFLGAKKMKGELGEDYVDTLHHLYEGRLPGFSDLVTYWFERTRTEIENGNISRAGLLATNSIGMGTNLEVLKRIKRSGNIFMAYPDRDWVLDGAAVRVAMIGFDDGKENKYILNGMPVNKINANLTSTVDITKAKILATNENIGFIGVQKSGPFDIDENLAKTMLLQTNVSGVNNTDVVRPIMNGSDLVRRSSNRYIIDFGVDTPLEKAQEYEEPFRYIQENVPPKRTAKHFKNYPFWLLWNTRPAMRKKMSGKEKYIATPTVAKHRLFIWNSIDIVPDKQLVAIARSDDYFFGVLHSKLHEIWSLRMGTSLEDRPRYTPTTTFETFPFPWSPSEEDTQADEYWTISDAAKQLHEERDAWLNPEDDGLIKIKDVTLTNLYNALVAYREQEGRQLDMPKNIKRYAWEFAPRLAELHDTLDRAVCDAYGWPHNVLGDEEEILRRLLELNLERAEK